MKAFCLSAAAVFWLMGCSASAEKSEEAPIEEVTIPGTSLKIKNESSYELDEIVWQGVSFAGSGAAPLKSGYVSTKAVESGSGYIFFVRKQDALKVRTNVIVTVDEGQAEEFTIIDNTMIVEIENQSNTPFPLSNARCGNSSYNISDGFCVNNEVHYKCNSLVYNPGYQKCESNKIINILDEIIDQRDNTTYRTTKIGTQVWMAENLNFDTQNSKCYNNSPEYCKSYGRLYNWAEAANCPDGFHLPYDTEWQTLRDYVNASKENRNTIAFSLKASSGWNGKYGNNAFGFNALPGGGYSTRFAQIDTAGYWWSATETNINEAIRRTLGDSDLTNGNADKARLYSVRCLRN